MSMCCEGAEHVRVVNMRCEGEALGMMRCDWNIIGGHHEGGREGHTQGEGGGHAEEV